MSLYLGNTIISGVTTPIEPTRNVGQIITSTIPLTDAGLHLLDGSLIQSGGIYDDFVQYMINLVNIYPQCFTDEITWQNTVSSKGVCGKFVYDSTNNTIRLPKITGFIEGTVDSNALGDLVEAGLPNIMGTFGGRPHVSGSSEFSGALVKSNITGAFQLSIHGGTGNDTGMAESSTYSSNDVMSFDASRSSSIYSNSTTVQPQSIKVFYYIVIATNTKTDIEVDIDEIVTDLNNKANDADVVHKINNETINGTKTFSNSPIVPTPAVSSNTTIPATTAYVNNKFMLVSALPASPDADTYYFIPE